MEFKAASEPRKTSLSHAQMALLELMHEMDFGRIMNLHVRSGEPVFHPPPRVVCEIKLGTHSIQARERQKDDFALKAQVIELFDLLSSLGDGVVRCLQVKHGLPFLLHIEGVPPR